MPWRKTAIKDKLHDANACVNEVVNEQYQETKATRTNAIKTEDDHKLALSELMVKFYM